MGDTATAENEIGVQWKQISGFTFFKATFIREAQSHPGTELFQTQNCVVTGYLFLCGKKGLLRLFASISWRSILFKKFYQKKNDAP